jgi:hypothetical protein
MLVASKADVGDSPHAVAAVQCVVASVRNPQTQTSTIREYYGRRDEHGNRKYRLVEIVASKSISVSLDCS